jgi:hypothetical protein
VATSLDARSQHSRVHGETYRELRDWLLRKRLVEHVKMSKSESGPFIVDTEFYGESFEAAVDGVRLASKKKKPRRRAAPLPSYSDSELRRFSHRGVSPFASLRFRAIRIGRLRRQICKYNSL